MTSHHLVSPDPQNRPNAGIRRLAYVLTAWLAALVMSAAMVTGQKLALALALVVVFGALSWGWPGLIGLPNRGVSRAGVAVIGCGITAVEESKEGTGTRDKVVGICDIVLGAIMAIAPFAFINAIGIISGLALLVAGSTQILASMKMPEESFAKKR